MVSRLKDSATVPKASHKINKPKQHGSVERTASTPKIDRLSAATYCADPSWPFCLPCQKSAICLLWSRSKLSARRQYFCQHRAKALTTVLLVRRGAAENYADFNVNRARVVDAMIWLNAKNPLYNNIEISTGN